MNLSPNVYRVLHKVHKVCALSAMAWLIVLGLSGIALDHYEWRWLSQTSVPRAWVSEEVGRLINGTIMRHVVVDEQDNRRWLGGSERGLWSTDNNGDSWKVMPFQGGDTPQVFALVQVGGKGSLAGVFVASDNGLWQINGSADQAIPLGLQGRSITSLSEGRKAGTLMGVMGKSRIFEWDLANGEVVSLITTDNTRIDNLSENVDLYRFLMDLHFGKGLITGKWGIWLNDIAGVAFVFLSLTGLFYWLLPRIMRRVKWKGATKRKVNQWAFRIHGPTIGLIAFIPMFYIVLTAVPMNHVRDFLPWTKAQALPRATLPPVYQGHSLENEIKFLATWPTDETRISLGTRFGILDSFDDGRTWTVNQQLVLQAGHNGSATLVRNGPYLLTSDSASKHLLSYEGGDWQPLSGPTFRLTDITWDGETLYTKNSRSVFAANNQDHDMARHDMNFKSAATDATLFLFMADVHLGLIFSPQFKYVNDLVALFALFIILSGLVMWFKVRWR